MRIATWNLARPVEVRGERLRRLEAVIAAQPADIWVLTETVTTLRAPDGFQGCHAEPDGPGMGSPARWVSIWTRFEILETMLTSDPVRHVAVRLRIPEERELIVCGTVLPWLGSSWNGVRARGGAAFAAAVREQESDWAAFVAAHPEAELVIAGDFNQDFSASRYYGSKANRGVLESALTRVQARLMTGGEDDPVPAHAPEHASVDHIAIRSKHPGWRAVLGDSWPKRTEPDRELSDHYGVAVSRGEEGTVRTRGFAHRSTSRPTSEMPPRSGVA